MWSSQESHHGFVGVTSGHPTSHPVCGAGFDGTPRQPTPNPFFRAAQAPWYARLLWFALLCLPVVLAVMAWGTWVNPSRYRKDDGRFDWERVMVVSAWWLVGVPAAIVLPLWSYVLVTLIF